MPIMFDSFDTGYAGEFLGGRALPTGQTWQVENIQRSDFQCNLDGDGNLNMVWYNTSSPAIAAVPATPTNRLRVELGGTFDSVSYLRLQVRGNGVAWSQSIYFHVTADSAQLTMFDVVVASVSGTPKPLASLEVVYNPDSGVLRGFIDDQVVVTYVLTAEQKSTAANWQQLTDGFKILSSLNGGSLKLARIEASDLFPPDPPVGWQWTVRRVTEQ